MENKDQNSDDFGTFLESVQRAVKPGDMSNTSSMRIMTVLSKLGEVEMTQLLTVVEMTWSEFSGGIESLKSAGLVEVDETNQGGKVQLTPDGRHWANALSSPADDREI
jgi:predicted transcriptional regulator